MNCDVVTFVWTDDESAVLSRSLEASVTAVPSGNEHGRSLVPNRDEERRQQAVHRRLLLHAELPRGPRRCLPLFVFFFSLLFLPFLQKSSRNTQKVKKNDFFFKSDKTKQDANFRGNSLFQSYVQYKHN